MCHGCLPQRLGNCVNTVQTQPPQAALTGTRRPFSPENSSSGHTPSVLARSPPSAAPHLSLSRSSVPHSSPELLSSPEISPVLPAFSPSAEPSFTWGSFDSGTFINSLNATYDEVVHWKPNFFKVRYGITGKSFVSELSRLYRAFATGSAMESIAMKAAIVLPILLLQKPSHNSKAKDHSACRERRLKTWQNGDLNDLLLEGRTIQLRIPKSSLKDSQKNLARSFANLMFQRKTKATLRLLSDQGKNAVLCLGDLVDEKRTVRDIIIDKHPPGQPAHPDSIIKDDPPDIHPVLFESIDASMIRSAALQTTGAAGPSGLDASSWRRLCTSFKSASFDLCHSLASAAKRLCTNFIDPATITPLLACRLIALNKNPGVRPIGIGATARRIMAKAILTVTRMDIQEAAGSLQLCAGQISGIEASVHAVRSLFKRDETEAVLLVDASNAFNSLNCLSALHNIRRLCPYQLLQSAD